MDWLEVFISLTLLFAGIITLAFRNRRQYFIGFRVGYTYMSDKAWRKANTFAGLYMVFFSLFLLALTLLTSRPIVFQLAPKFRGKMALGFARVMTVVSAMITLQLAVVALKPNASPLVGILLLLASLGAVFYAAFIALTSTYEESYY